MTEQPRWRRYLRFWGADIGADVDEEMSFHLERLIEEYRAAGAAPEEAARLARRRFGDHAQYEARCIAIDEETAMKHRRQAVLDTLRQDLRFGVRQLRRNPLVSVTALLTIALAIGASTAIFSVVNAVLLRPLPYHSVERLMVMQLSVPEYRELRDRQRSFEELTIWASNQYSIAGDDPEEVLGGQVEPGFFPMLMQPAMGRAFSAEESDASVAVIGDALWARRFNRSPDVLGRTLTMSGRTYGIVGVIPASFQYPNASFEVWVPFASAVGSAPEQLENRQLRIFRVVGRRRADVTAEQAAAELRAISEDWQRQHPQTNEGRVIVPTALSEQLLGDIRPRLTMLLVAVTFVLLIACVNVANLMLGATARRGRELAVRRAIGAPRTRLLRQLLTESLVLALLGGAAGLGIAALCLRVLPRIAVDVPRMSEVTLDHRVLLFSFAASVITALLFGIAPALRGSSAGVRDALQEGGRGGIGTRSGGRLRALLVAVEVAVSVVVLVAAGLLVHSLARVLEEETGIEAESLINTNVGLFYFDDRAERVVRLDQALERVAALDGVSAAAASSGLPPQTAQRGTAFSVVGRVPDAAEQDGALWVAVTPGYFTTVGARVLRGREFEATDRGGSMPVALISEALARALFGDADAVGRQIRLTNPDAGDEPRTIVGVVNDIRYSGVELPAEPTIYTPFSQTPFLWAYIMARTTTPAQQLAPALRNAIGAVDPRMTPSRVTQHNTLLSDLLAQRRFITLLLGSFAALALSLAAIGIYGVTATGVTQRRREIGVRIALGAEPRTVLRDVVARALALVAAGLAAGTVASLWLSRLLQAMLYEVEPRDPATFAAGVMLMICVGVTASAVPAWRASRVDPLVTLREQ